MNSVERVHIHMRRFIGIFTAVLLCGHSTIAAEQPLVAFDFEDGLKNAGTLGGAGQLKTYAPGEEASYELGPFGRCLDLTAASRMAARARRNCRLAARPSFGTRHSINSRHSPSRCGRVRTR